MKKVKKGVSLVTLVISIIIMIILASVAILNIGQTGILKRAKEAAFKGDLEGYMTELSLYIKNKQSTDYDFDFKTVNTTDATISTYISSIKEEDIAKFIVIGGNLVYIGNNLDEQKWCEEIGIGNLSGYDAQNNVNTPKLAEGMIPVRYDESQSTWVKADKNNVNNDWYKYDDVERKWANVVTVRASGIKTREYYLDAPNGTPIDMADITTMFVWIPRYAYSINEGYYRTSDTLSEGLAASNSKIDISFLVGTTNSSFDGTEYTTYDTDYIADGVWPGEATPKIVHPAFKFGDDILTGIWVAKFEAGKSEEAQVNIKPNVNSWRSISIGNTQYESMRIKYNENDVYGFNKDNVDTHLIKNTEWGAVAYLSASPYGKVPMINANTDLMTGYQGTSNVYNTVQGEKASTTHNIYGIYDMNGGAWERVAAYLDNSNTNLSEQADLYFKDNMLKKEYEKYWDRYLATEEDKLNRIKVVDLGDGITEVAREELLKATININEEEVNTQPWNESRQRLAKDTYQLMSAVKGDAMNEITRQYSYYGVYFNTQSSKWSFLYMKDMYNTANLWSWNGDWMWFATISGSFIVRGGYMNYGSGSGIFTTRLSNDISAMQDGFRPTCIVY